MCYCTPEIRTPHCGSANCHPPLAAKPIKPHELAEKLKAYIPAGLDGYNFEFASDLSEVVEYLESLAKPVAWMNKEGSVMTDDEKEHHEKHHFSRVTVHPISHGYDIPLGVIE